MLQAAMEMGLLVDYRQQALLEEFKLAFTADGFKVYNTLKPLLKNIDLSFRADEDGDYSWSMNCESTVNKDIRNFISQNPDSLNLIHSVILEMDAVNLLLKYLYSIQRKERIKKSEIYNDFFEAPFVKAYLDRHGLETPTEEVRKRRIPFLINILDALGIINQSASEIDVLGFIPAKEVLRFDPSEKDDIIQERIGKLKTFADSGVNNFSPEEVSLLKETFGATFLTTAYYLNIRQI